MRPDCNDATDFLVLNVLWWAGTLLCQSCLAPSGVALRLTSCSPVDWLATTDSLQIMSAMLAHMSSLRSLGSRAELSLSSFLRDSCSRALCESMVDVRRGEESGTLIEKVRRLGRGNCHDGGSRAYGLFLPPRDLGKQ
jgi:hypothetical protein